jgi:tRNA-dihydrouridine synthase A
VQYQSHRFCVAPLMDWSDRHCRVLHRLLSARALVYTEMIVANAVIHGNRERLLGFDAAEHPVALQLGGSDPDDLARAAEIGAEFGYDEINLNCGCPSTRVQGGSFGACLMATPDVVARCVAAMRRVVDVPVTVKCRIGIDDQDAETDFSRFVDVVAAAGCSTFIVHARKAWLQGLSPKENRDVPPLDYGRVFRLKAARPELTIVLNGGIETLQQGEAYLGEVDGVMLGRAAYHTPYLLAEVDQRLFDPSACVPTRDKVMAGFAAYAERKLAEGARLSSMTRHILGLYHARPGGRLFRRVLAEKAVRPGAGLEVLAEAMEQVEGATAARYAADGQRRGLVDAS